MKLRRRAGDSINADAVELLDGFRRVHDFAQFAVEPLHDVGAHARGGEYRQPAQLPPLINGIVAGTVTVTTSISPERMWVSAMLAPLYGT